MMRMNEGAVNLFLDYVISTREYQLKKAVYLQSTESIRRSDNAHQFGTGLIAKIKLLDNVLKEEGFNDYFSDKGNRMLLFRHMFSEMENMQNMYIKESIDSGKHQSTKPDKSYDSPYNELSYVFAYGVFHALRHNPELLTKSKELSERRKFVPESVPQENRVGEFVSGVLSEYLLINYCIQRHKEILELYANSRQ